MPNVIVGAKAEKFKWVEAELSKRGVVLVECKTVADIGAAIDVALKPIDDLNALETELEQSVARVEELEADLGTAQKELSVAKGKLAAFEKRLGALNTDGGDDAAASAQPTGDPSAEPKKAGESAKGGDALGSQVEAAVAKVLADNYRQAGGGLEALGGDQSTGEASDPESVIESCETEGDFHKAMASAKSVDDQDKIYAAMRKKFPL